MYDHKSGASPTIRMLEAKLNASDRAVFEFWQERQTNGPLIEPSPTGNDHRLVTFLWRGDAERVCVNSVAGLGSIADNTMVRIGDTDLFYRTYDFPSSLRLRYRFIVDPPLVDQYTAPTPEKERLFEYLRRPGVAQRDELNETEDERALPSLRGGDSYLRLPDAPAHEWLLNEGQSVRIESSTFSSVSLDNERTVSVYVPGGNKGTYKTVVLFDGEGYSGFARTPQVLDFLIKHEAIPPTIGVFVHNADFSQRAHELLGNVQFEDAIATELWPKLRGQYPISDNPDDVVFGGSSAGAVAAASILLRYPEIGNNLLSQSGGFWVCSAEALATSTRDESLIDRWQTSGRLLRGAYLEIGRYERSPFADPIESNRRFVRVLQDCQTPVQYSEYAGGHDFFYWAGSIAAGFKALL